MELKQKFCDEASFDVSPWGLRFFRRIESGRF